tara:strand:- start:10542 stop:10787 length:246 start_codon:yes stop_codon:yes gene_type:complete
MFVCVFCEKEYVFTSNLCADCRSLKHTKLLYGDKFNSVINNVLLRNEEGIKNKENNELKKEKTEIENEIVLRNKVVKKNIM